MSEILERHYDDHEEWPHILETRVSRWHLPLDIPVVPLDEANAPTIEYAPTHNGMVLLDGMSVSFS